MLRRKAFTSLQHGFLRSVENGFIHNFVTPNGVCEMFFLYNIDTYFYYDCLADVMPYCVIGRCFCLADVVCLLKCGRCYCQEEDVILLFLCDWQMLLPYFCGRCYTTFHYVATYCIG